MDNLAGQKHGCSSATSDSSSNDTAKKAKHQVTVRTYEKWQCELDPEYHTLAWLQCEKNKILTHFTDSMLSLCSNEALADLQKMNDRSKERLAWSDVDLLQSILVFLDTRSWSTQRQVAWKQ